VYRSHGADEPRAKEATMPRPPTVIRALLAGAILAGVVTADTPASAGGGCHTGPTQGTGTTVGLKDACFTPSLLRVAEGSTVTFTNLDPFVHNVSGSLWGHYDDLRPNTTFSATFDRAGIYPYACTIHPGMTGVIVVGDGVGPGNGAVVTSVSPGSSGPTTPDAAPVAPDDRWAQAVALVVGLAFGGIVGIALAAHRRVQDPRVRVPSA
jgi:plastocyanin